MLDLKTAFNGPYLKENQLPTDLPLAQMCKLLAWRLAVVVMVGVAAAIFVIALAVLHLSLDL